MKKMRHPLNQGGLELPTIFERIHLFLRCLNRMDLFFEKLEVIAEDIRLTYRCISERQHGSKGARVI